MLWSLVHIVFLEIKKELHPAISFAFDSIAMVITIIYGIVIITPVATLESISVDDTYAGAVQTISGKLEFLIVAMARLKSIGGHSYVSSEEIVCGSLMILTGYVLLEARSDLIVLMRLF